MRRLALAVAVSAGAIAIVGPTASLEAGGGLKWSKPEAVSAAGRNVSFPEVGVDANGAATAVWMQIDDLASSTPNWKIRSAARPLGGGWVVNPTPLSGEGAFAPGLGVGGDGSAVATWEVGIGESTGREQGSARPSGGTFGPAVDLSSSGDEPGGAGASIALDENGNGAVAYEVIGQFSNHLEVRAVVLGTFAGSTATITGGSSTAISFTSLPHAFAGATGTYVAYGKEFFPSTRPFLIGPMSAGAFGAGVEMMPASFGDGRNPSVTEGPGGALVKSWVSTDGLYVAVGGEDPVRVSDGKTNVFSSSVAAGHDGTIIATWNEEVDDGTFRSHVLGAVRRASGSSFESPEILSEAGDGLTPPQIAFAGTTAIIVWSRDTGLFPRVEESSLPAGGSFSAVAKTLSGSVGGDDGDATYPTIAATAGGQATVVWMQSFKDKASGRLYRRVIATNLVAGKPDVKPPKLTRAKASPERFAAGTHLGDVVVVSNEKTAMYPDGQGGRPLRAGTEFVFASSEAGTYTIDIQGAGCLVFLEEGNKLREHDAPGPCPADDDHVTLTGAAVAKKKMRVPFFGAGLHPGGTYAVTVTVTDAAGNVSKSKATEFRFDGP